MLIGSYRQIGGSTGAQSRQDAQDGVNSLSPLPQVSHVAICGDLAQTDPTPTHVHHDAVGPINVETFDVCVIVVTLLSKLAQIGRLIDIASKLLFVSMMVRQHVIGWIPGRYQLYLLLLCLYNLLFYFLYLL